MYVIVVGGGKVGYYLTKELLAAGHELVLLEKDPRRARQIADEVGSIVLARDGCEGKHLAEAGANRAAIVAAVTGDDEDNLVVCQMAKHHFDVPRTIARVNNPATRSSSGTSAWTRSSAPRAWSWPPSSRTSRSTSCSTWPSSRAASWSSSRPRSPTDRRPSAAGRRDIDLPDGCSLFVLIRDEVAQAIRPETVFQVGDKVIAITRTDCEPDLHRQLIGSAEVGVG